MYCMATARSTVGHPYSISISRRLSACLPCCTCTLKRSPFEFRAWLGGCWCTMRWSLVAGSGGATGTVRICKNGGVVSAFYTSYIGLYGTAHTPVKYLQSTRPPWKRDTRQSTDGSSDAMGQASSISAARIVATCTLPTLVSCLAGSGPWTAVQTPTHCLFLLW